MSDAQDVKTLTIDGVEVSALRGATILEVAREHDIQIPTLCHLEGLSDVGACRLCLVEIKGSNKLLPACVATVFEGMEVSTNTERLQKHRRMILEMLFAERNHICPVCVSNGHCELQTLGQEQGLTHIRLPYRNPSLKVDASHERFTVDHNRCVLCMRCVLQMHTGIQHLARGIRTSIVWWRQDEEPRVRGAVADCLQQLAKQQGTSVFDIMGQQIIASIQTAFVSVCLSRQSL